MASLHRLSVWLWTRWSFSAIILLTGTLHVDSSVSVLPPQSSTIEKMEKADILQMTVDYMRAKAAVTSRIGSERYRTCQSEAAPSIDITSASDDKTQARLARHLQWSFWRARNAPGKVVRRGGESSSSTTSSAMTEDSASSSGLTISVAARRMVAAAVPLSSAGDAVWRPWWRLACLRRNRLVVNKLPISVLHENESAVCIGL